MNLRLDATVAGNLILSRHDPRGDVVGQVLELEQMAREEGCLRVRVTFDGLTPAERGRAAEMLARFAGVERALGHEREALDLERLSDRLAASAAVPQGARS